MPGTWIADYGPSVAWMIAAGGLIYNNWSANSREKRKEFRAEIDAVEKVIKDLVAKSGTYVRSVERDEASRVLELEIKVLFKEVDLKWDRLSRRQSGGELGLLIDPCSTALEQLFDHATGKYFETAERPVGDDLASYLEKTHVLSLTFIEALHSLFLKKFDNL